MKFSSRAENIAKGKRAELRLDCPLDDGTSVPFAVRPLDGAETQKAVAGAIAHARSLDVREEAIGDGQPIYDMALWAHTLLIASVDVESPENARERFFDGGIDQILGMHPETTAMLYERQQIWQEECAPTRTAKTLPQLFALTKEIAEADGDGPFVGLSPLTRATWARTTAKLLMGSPELKSLFSLPTPVSIGPK